MNNSKNTGLINDTVTLQSIRNFLSSEKPNNIQPIDVLHVIKLIVRKAEDHEIYDSQQSLAQSFGCDTQTIRRSQQRLQKMKWLSRPQRKGRTNALSLVYENIPSEKAVRTLVTQDAKQLSLRYMNGLRRVGLRRKFPKPWLDRQFLSAQRILNKCDGDIEKAARIIGHAIGNPKHQNSAKKSLYELLGRWPKIMQTYAAKTQTQQTEQAQPTKSIQAYETELDALVGREGMK